MTLLDHFFGRVPDRYTRSAHLEDLAGFAGWLREGEYPNNTAQRLLSRTLQALESSGRRPGGRWTCADLEQAFGHRRSFRRARRRFGEFLHGVGRLTPRPETGPHRSVLAGYQRYLLQTRGLARSTIGQHLAEVGALLKDALPKGQRLRELTVQHIEEHLQHRAAQISRRFLQSSVGCLRSFLRYCWERHLIARRLDGLDRPVCWRDERPPRALKWSRVQQFLRSIDRTRSSGWRDFMILHLMAHYGLRTGEITRLRVDWINWSDRTLWVEQFKTRSWLRLPLMNPTLAALREYLRKGRPPSRRGELFLRAKAPIGPMTSGALCELWKARAHQSGSDLAKSSPYALRHSFAMRLLARGVGIKLIGDLMGHQSLRSTAVYLRLQTEALRDVALPVPRPRQPRRGAA